MLVPPACLPARLPGCVPAGLLLQAGLADSDVGFAACAASCRAAALQSFQQAFHKHLLIEGEGEGQGRDARGVRALQRGLRQPACLPACVG